MPLQKTLAFLSDLAQNNDREWMKANKKHYENARDEFKDFLQQILNHLATHLGEDFAHIQPKDCIFRIHRDVRFSKNKTPYKVHFGAVLHPEGRHTEAPLFYLHIEPNNNFLAVGVWEPPSSYLKKIREEIDYNAEELHQIFKENPFNKYFSSFEELPNGKLKTAPRGYPKDHPEIELLRLKHFIAQAELSDREITQPEAAQKVADMFLAGQPLKDWLKVVWEETKETQE